MTINSASLLALLQSLALLLIPSCAGGCQLFQPNTEPLERGMTAMMEQVVAPAVSKAADEVTVRTAQLQGQGSFICPGYQVDFKGGMFNGVEGSVVIRVVGVSANLAAAAQGDAGQPGTVQPPADRADQPPEGGGPE